MLHRISSQELTEWIAFYKIENDEQVQHRKAEDAERNPGRQRPP